MEQRDIAELLYNVEEITDIMKACDDIASLHPDEALVIDGVFYPVWEVASHQFLDPLEYELINKDCF